MANEITIQTVLRINNGNEQYTSSPTQFRVDKVAVGGPTPGQINVPETGINVDLSTLDVPGECLIQNLDDTNYVIGGIHDGTSFFPLFELLPGRAIPFRFYRFFGSEFVGTGTPADVNNFHLMSIGGTCKVKVDAFEA